MDWISSQLEGNPILYNIIFMGIVLIFLASDFMSFFRDEKNLLKDDFGSMVLKIMIMAKRSFFPYMGLLLD